MSEFEILGTAAWLLVSLLGAVIIASFAQFRKAEPDVFDWLLWAGAVMAVLFVGGEAIYWGAKIALVFNGYGSTDAG